ncbi:CynX/NimT family MFS transporter [Pseudorhodoferax sp. Leaf267]|uniref:MFS transporter n=1 Tax=Pseudorhodoferax sp. Leaf267 TaxID=1736316 RepID=UPI0006FE88CB|nr:MFS transporter [Pseudorhodoferax sp. Leaf267]KQP14745.1 MFS transporter [Pseudorhodoferax sp. Leaf267]
MAEATARRGLDPALIVVLAAVSAALHVGKLPPALPVLQGMLGLSLVQAGFLVSMVQLAGMGLGLLVGLAGDGLGLRRCMLTGLLVLSAASVAGGFVHDATGLLALRACEGFGFLLAVTPGPSLIRRSVASGDLDAKLGLWGAYMPLGTALALLAGPWLLPHTGWPGWWWLVASASAVMAAWVWRAVPADPATAGASRAVWSRRAGSTLAAPGPWLLGFSFAVYSGQWLAVIGFLPTVYAQAQIASVTAGALTGLAAAVNMVGNIVAGRLLRRGAAPRTLLRIGFAAMAVGAAYAFMPVLDAGPLVRYAAILVFSLVGGLVPATLFALCVRLAPGSDTVSTTVGWMQQCSAFGQFIGPPLVGWIAKQAGGWQWTWAATGACCVAGIVLAGRLHALLARRATT